MFRLSISFLLDKKQPSVTSTASFHLLAYTNRSSNWDARQWVKTLLLFVLSGPCVFDSHCTIQKKLYLSCNSKNLALSSSYHSKGLSLSSSFHISIQSFVINQSGTTCKEEESPFTTL